MLFHTIREEYMSGMSSFVNRVLSRICGHIKRKLNGLELSGRLFKIP